MPKKNITLGHSPDADDAFMFYAVSKGIVKSKKLNLLILLKIYRHLTIWQSIKS